MTDQELLTAIGNVIEGLRASNDPIAKESLKAITKEMRRLLDENAELRAQIRRSTAFLDDALNSGDGTYKP